MTERPTQDRLVTWDNSTTSNIISINGFNTGLTLELPSNAPAGPYTIEGRSRDSRPWRSLVKDGEDVSLVVTVDAFNHLPVEKLFGLKEIRFVASEAGTAKGYLLITP